MPRIEQLFAYITSDTDADDEGIIAMQTPEGMMPLVGADEARMASYRELAQMTATGSGRQVRLIAFDGPPRVIETIEP